MSSPSKTFSPAKFKAMIIRRSGGEDELLYQEEKELGMSEGPDKATVGNEIGLSGVFGPYTTLKTIVVIEGRLDLSEGPDALKKFSEFWGLHTADNIQMLQNKLLELTGRKAFWDADGKAAEEEPPKKKRKPKTK